MSPSSDRHEPPPAPPLVLYDGTCGMCAASVQWILRHERDHALQFAPLQGETAAAARARYPAIPVAIDTIVLVKDDRAYLRSAALLHIADHLRAPWRWSRVLRWCPSFLRDLGYRAVAAMRYRLWRRVDACALVPPAQRARFLA